MAYKINDLTALGRNLDPTDELEVSLAGATGSRKITGQQIIDSAKGGGLFVPIKTVASSWYSNTILSENQTTYTIANSNAMFITPFIANNTIVVSDLSIWCNGTGATQEAKIFIYSSSNGKPLTQLAISSGINLATVGIKTFTLPSNLTLTAGTTYWIGLIYKDFGVGSLYGNDGGKAIAISSDNTTGTPYNTFVYPVSYASVPSTLTQGSLISLNYANVARINFKAV
jgi:hypothetical protein